MDPEQTESDLGLHCLQYRLLKHFSRREMQTTFVAIGALRVNQFLNSLYAGLRQIAAANGLGEDLIQLRET